VNKVQEMYNEVDTSNKPPLDLLLKVYDGGLQAFGRAQDAYRKNEYQKGYDELERARRFVVHLYTTLNFEQGGEVADNLGKLYIFLMNEIDFVEATKQSDRIDSCIKVIKNIREGWTNLKQDQPNYQPHMVVPDNETKNRTVTLTA
jgi:flagellar secretion chaperone FliS